MQRQLRINAILVLALVAAVVVSVAHSAARQPGRPGNPAPVTAAASATVPAPREVNYAGTTDSHQTLDAYYDAAATNRAWVMTIHGGSWAAGDKRNDASMTHAVDTFYGAGFVVFNVDYDLVSDYSNYTGVPWAQQRSDILTALRYVRAHASTYGIDPDRGALYGFSAGGHDAASVGLYSAKVLGVQAVVSASGVLEPQDVTDPTLAGWAAVAMRCPDVTWTDCAARWKDFEPASHANAGDPAMLMFTGGSDPLVPPSGATDLRAKLEQVGVPATAVVVPGVGHSDTTWYGNSANTQQMLDFVERYTSG